MTRLNFRSSVSVMAVLAAMVVVSIPARADVYGFTCITNNIAGDCVIGAAQLSVNVTDPGIAGFVDFTFNNAGPLASSITDLYWDDGTLLALSSIVSGPGTSFSAGASPPNLPGGNTVGFAATAGFTADSNSPTQPNGVNPGEFVTVRFSLQGTLGFADVINALNDDVNNPLLIGIHVQGFASGGSESLITGGEFTPQEVVPEPSFYLTLAPGMLGLMYMAYRRRRTA